MKKKSAQLCPILISIMLLLSGCSSSTDEGISGNSPASARSAPAQNMEDLPKLSNLPSSANLTNQEPAVGERLIIQDVSMTILVNSITGAIDNISSLTTNMKGFVVSSHISGDEGGEYGFISFRVPTDGTSQIRSQLREIAVRVLEESSQTKDVTEEYVDLQGRLNNLKRTEEQYIILLGRAETVEDMLKVQRELSNAQGQIEQTIGRMQYLERTSAMSLISVNLHQATSLEPLMSPGWSFQETIKDAFRSMASFGQWLASAIIWIVIYSPVWASLLIVAYLLGRWLLRRMPHSHTKGRN
jgi:hypothetical protein